MHARVSYIQAQADRIDDVVAQVKSDVVPTLAGQDGFKGFTVLVDRDSGQVVGISFWESEDAMKASEEVADQSRREAADTAAAPEPRVHRFEVAVDVTA